MLGRPWLFPVLALVVATAVFVPIALVGGDAAPVIPREKPTVRPKDRDPAAVTTALRRIDPCLLFDGAGVPSGPHACRLPAGDVQVGTFSDQVSRYPQAPVVLGGAKAYEYAGRSSCHVVVPVSFVRAIDFGAATCPAVRQVATTAVTRLRNPDTVAFRDASRPFSAWDGCSLLEAVLGEQPGFRPFGQYDPFSGCAAAGGVPAIEISYTDQASPNRKVGLSEHGGQCTAAWTSRNTAVRLTTQDCHTAAAAAEQVIALGGKAPADTRPQRPLLFGPHDDDTGAVGACVHFRHDDCVPYQDVPVPDDPDDIIAAAQVNRHVQCAVFADAVRATFGPRFAPVVWGAYCFFVDAAHSVEIRVSIGGAAADGFEIHVRVNERGSLYLAVRMIGGRGKEFTAPPRLPARQADLAAKAMARTVEAYFRV